MLPDVDALRRFFLKSFWTYRKLSEATGVREETLRYLLTGQTQRPHPRTLARIQLFLAAERKKSPKRR